MEIVNLLPKTQPEAPSSTATWKEDYCKDSQMITTEKTDICLEHISEIANSTTTLTILSILTQN
jgi:hypothetical protein